MEQGVLFNFVSGFMVGIEFYDDGYTNYLLFDLGIFRITFFKDYA